MHIGRSPVIVLLGMMSHMPVGGNVWLVLQYLEGFRRLGYDPYYVEAHGLNPSMLTRHPADDAAARAADFIAGVLGRFDFGDRWAYQEQHPPHRVFGLSPARLGDLYATAALVINLHGGTMPLPEHSARGRLVYLGTDPVEVEVEIDQGLAKTIEFLEPHCAFFTWGTNHGRPDCRVPTSERFRFRPTRPPVVADLFSPPSMTGGLPPPVIDGGLNTCYTTVGNWRQMRREITFRGEVYHWSKHFEFLKFLDLPARTGRAFELALSHGTCDEADRALLAANGWRVRDALEVSTDLDAYRRYLAGSRGEWTVAKDQNVRLRSGWFSERSAQYLACGRPVITQDTGFGNDLPTGRGLFAFATLDEAAAAVEAVESDYAGHCRAAAELAREYFSYDVVLGRMLSELGLPIKSGNGTAGVTGKNPPLSSPRVPRGSISGVNLAGYLRAESGVGTATRGYLRALEAASVPVALCDLSHLQVNRSEDDSHPDEHDEHPHPVNLICADVELHYAILSSVGEDFFRDRYNVGIWAWELPGFPERWRDRFAYYDEIWVGTSFVANALAPVSPVPVVRVPPVLTPSAVGDRARGRARLGAADDEFVFLFVFDFHSHAARKNPRAVAEAFARAFTPADNVRLVLKCVNGASNPAGLAELADLARGHRVEVHDGYWPAGDVRDLMAASDAYVSLHRSEGTGLTVAEALALGKPVIATGWSGNTDFMDSSNSYPVAYELVELRDNFGPYRAGERWAEPSVEHAAQLMRHVVTHRDHAAALGAAGRHRIATEFGPGAVAAVIRRRLEAIALCRRLPAFRAEVRARFHDYRRLPERLRAAVAAAVPAGATVLVVSKGDAALTAFDGRPGWHFPRDPSGAYAGFYPADDAAAVAHLEDLRRRGSGFLLFPATAFWWLAHYAGLHRHLEAHYRRTWSDESCVLYDLAGPASGSRLQALGSRPEDLGSGPEACSLEPEVSQGSPA